MTRRSLIGIIAFLLVMPAAAQHQHGSGQGAQSHAIEMNQRWMAPDVDVAPWVAQFEDPARDVIAHQSAVIAAMRLQPGQQVADVGAGTGAYAGALSRAVGPDGHVFAVDIAPGFVTYIASRAARDKLGNVSAVLGHADDPTLPAGALDAVLTVNTFHHFAAPEAMLGKLHRALKPGGQLVVVDFDVAADITPQQRADVRLDRAGHVRLIEAHGFRLIEDVKSTGLRQNFMLRFARR